MIDILPTLALCTNQSVFEKKLLRIWALVLEARGVEYHLEPTPKLMVSPALAQIAVAEILAYESENTTIPHPAPLPDNSWPSLLLLVVFVALNIWVEHWDIEKQWALFEAGRIEAKLVVQGQWWRCVTALFLHADASHLFSNIAALGLLASLLARRLGSGLTWSFFLISGALGNALNSWVQSPEHWSIGASTGVFGLIGVLAGNAGRYTPGRRRTSAVLLSLGFGFSLLAMLGAGQERVDLGAHLFGLFCGLPLGLMMSLEWFQTRSQSLKHSIYAGLGCLAVSIWSWIMALAV